MDLVPGSENRCSEIFKKDSEKRVKVWLFASFICRGAVNMVTDAGMNIPVIKGNKVNL